MNQKSFVSELDDPFFNLALENYLLEKATSNNNNSFLLLYINRPCVVMGRFQNPWIECNLNKMKKDSILLVRRQSGGGTVYHDYNNVNYSLISPKSSYDKSSNFNFLIDVLESLNIKAFKSERGDLRLVETQSRKISGTAYKEKKDSAFQHGTMLINSDLDLLNLYIEPSLKGVQSKSIDSVRSTVANLSMIAPEITNTSFIQNATSLFNPDSKPVVVDNDSLLAQEVFNSDYYKSLIDVQWVYSETPQFEIVDNLSGCEINLVIKKLKITQCSLSSKEHHPLLMSAIESLVVGCHLFDVRKLLADEFSEEDFVEELKIWFGLYFKLENLP